MKKAITGFFMSWGMFCAIPCPLKIWNEKAKLYSVVFLPFVGALMGAIWAVIALVLKLLNVPQMLGAGICAVVPCLLSGFIHLDGFMDCCDAILSRRDLPERQRILKDSRTGAFAVICVVILFLLSFSSFTSGVKNSVWLLVFIPAAARSISAVSVLSFAPMGTSGYAKAYEDNRKGYKIGAFCIIGLIAVLPIVIFGASGICALIAQIAALIAVLYGRSQLGGMSGDISGYGITIGEIAGVIAFVLI